LSDVEILFARNDFHFKVSVCRIDDIELVDDGGGSLVGGFREDDGPNVVFVWKVVRAEVHVGYVTYCRETGGDVV